MQKFVKQIAKLYVSDEGAAQSFQKFYRLRQDEGWTEFVRLLHVVQGFMAEELLSDRFAELSPADKDVKQRVYAGLRRFLSFLENPSPEIERAMFLAGHDKALKNMMQQQKLKSVPAERR